jgi:Flp pilus assembly protein TadG
MRRLIAWLRRRDRGVSTIEMALLLPGVLLPLTFAIIGAGMIMWTQGSLQSTADLAARCGAIDSPSCSGGASGVETYAVDTADNWIMSGIINTGDVLVNAAATDCTALSSNVEIVEIKTSYFTTQVFPFLQGKFSKSIEVCAYYPKCPTC